MKNFTLVCFAAMALVLSVQAQGGGPGPERLERVEALKAAFITEKLALTPEEAQKFWPVYNQFEAERRELRKSYRIGPGPDSRPPGTLTDAEADEMIGRELEFRQKELELTRKYMTEFRQVLPVSKVAAIPQVEEQFRRMIIEKIRGGQEGPPPGSPR